MNDEWHLTVKVRKHTDNEVPTSMEEAIDIVTALLGNGPFIEVVSVEPWWHAWEKAEGIDWGYEDE
jgi:hypothetical protein